MVLYRYTLCLLNRKINKFDFYVMPFSPIGDTLKQSLTNKKALQKQIEASDVVTAAVAVFIEVFGETEAVHVKPLYVKNRTLTVTCSGATVAQEIRLNQAEIVQKLNDTVGKNEVDRIRYLS